MVATVRRHYRQDHALRTAFAACGFVPTACSLLDGTVAPVTRRRRPTPSPSPSPGQLGYTEAVATGLWPEQWYSSVRRSTLQSWMYKLGIKFKRASRLERRLSTRETELYKAREEYFFASWVRRQPVHGRVYYDESTFDSNHQSERAWGVAGHTARMGAAKGLGVPLRLLAAIGLRRVDQHLVGFIHYAFHQRVRVGSDAPMPVHYPAVLEKFNSLGVHLPRTDLPHLATALGLAPDAAVAVIAAHIRLKRQDAAGSARWAMDAAQILCTVGIGARRHHQPRLPGDFYPNSALSAQAAAARTAQYNGISHLGARFLWCNGVATAFKYRELLSRVHATKHPALHQAESLRVEGRGEDTYTQCAVAMLLYLAIDVGFRCGDAPPRGPICPSRVRFR
jgi:hypothetical protein